MGCDRGFSFFDSPPPQCNFIRQQIGQLQNQYGALQRQAQGGGIEQRRAQLIAAIKRDGARPQLLGTPPDALPNTIRAVMVAN